MSCAAFRRTSPARSTTTSTEHPNGEASFGRYPYWLALFSPHDEWSLALRAERLSSSRFPWNGCAAPSLLASRFASSVVFSPGVHPAPRRVRPGHSRNATRYRRCTRARSGAVRRASVPSSPRCVHMRCSTQAAGVAANEHWLPWSCKKVAGSESHISPNHTVEE